MPSRVSALSVGSKELTHLVRDAFLLCPQSSLSVAETFWDLCSLSLREKEQVSVAVLDLSSSESELRQKAEHIRRRWPEAAILLVGDSLHHLDDPLYDERVASDIQPTELLAVVERLLAHKRLANRFRHCYLFEGVGRYGA
jgi:hypothetical protein